MASEILKSLLNEYSKNKIKAELDYEDRLNALYNKYPKLRQIEDELNKIAVSSAKNIIETGDNKEKQIELKNNIRKLKKEKEDFIKKLNLPDNYLHPNYTCNLCNDTGYVLDENNNSVMCTCLKQKLLDYTFNKSNLSNLSNINFDNFRADIFSDKVDATKYHFNISPRENIINIKNKCVQFVDNFNDPYQKNLLFTGNTGLR